MGTHLKRARDLVPGDMVIFATKRNRVIADIVPSTRVSMFYPYRSYKSVKVRWRGDKNYSWSTGASSWVCVESYSIPARYGNLRLPANRQKDRYVFRFIGRDDDEYVWRAKVQGNVPIEVRCRVNWFWNRDTN